MRRYVATILPFLALGLGQLGAASAAPTAWRTYSNPRFGYQTCYPHELLKPQPEADNGDGRKFVGADGAELLVFGWFNSDDRSLAQWASEEAVSYVGQKGTISYRVVRKDWAVLSGSDGKGSDFYMKVAKNGDAFVTYQIRYPTQKAGTYRPVVDRLAKCFAVTAPTL